MGSYGVIKEALLVHNDTDGKYNIVQKVVPSTVNGVQVQNVNGGFSIDGTSFAVWSINRGGVFGFSESTEAGQLLVSVNVPGYGTKIFRGAPRIENVNGIGECVKCVPNDPSGPYTHLCLVVESPGKVFAKV